MCGRMNVSDHPSVKMLCDALGISFEPIENDDLRPTDTVATIR